MSCVRTCVWVANGQGVAEAQGDCGSRGRGKWVRTKQKQNLLFLSQSHVGAEFHLFAKFTLLPGAIERTCVNGLAWVNPRYSQEAPGYVGRSHTVLEPRREEKRKNGLRCCLWLQRRWVSHQMRWQATMAKCLHWIYGQSLSKNLKRSRHGVNFRGPRFHFISVYH